MIGNSNSKNCLKNKSADKYIKNVSSNSLFQIKNFRTKNAKKVIIITLNIKSPSNKFDHLKELVLK